MRGYKDVLIIACEGIVYITQAPNNIKKFALMDMARIELKAPILHDPLYILNPKYEDIDHQNSITIEY